MSFKVIVVMIWRAWRSFVLGVVATMGLTSGHGWGQAPTTDQIPEIERRLIESRRSLQSGQVTLTVHHTIAQQPDLQGTTKHYDLFFEGGNLRADLSVSSPGGERSSQVVISDQTFIRAVGSTGAVQSFGAQTKPQRTNEVPDPRYLGLIVWSFDTLSQFGYERHFLRPERYDLQVTTGTHEGQMVWKVSYRHENRSGAEVITEYWLSRDQGEQPVYISVESGDVENRRKSTLNTKLDRYGNGEVWFPKKVTYRRLIGNQIESEEVVTVEDAVFGKSMASTAFTLAGLDLEEGRRVNHDGKNLVWTSQGLQTERQLLASQTTERNWRWWIFAGFALLFGVISGLAFWARRHG